VLAKATFFEKIFMKKISIPSKIIFQSRKSCGTPCIRHRSIAVREIAGSSPIFGAIGLFTYDKYARVSAAPMKIRAVTIIRDSQITGIRIKIACGTTFKHSRVPARMASFCHHFSGHTNRGLNLEMNADSSATL